MASPINPGSVDWSGENPGIYLKEREDGPWVALSVFFRVATSPHGRGVGALVLGEPTRAEGYPKATNLCITDNEPLLRWLVDQFVSRFASFRGVPALAALAYLRAESFATQGDARTSYEERAVASGATIVLRWDDLGEPFAADVPPASSATGRHQMYSVFVEARRATIEINGQSLPGHVMQRDFLERRMSTAFLAFSETWVVPPASA